MAFKNCTIFTKGIPKINDRKSKIDDFKIGVFNFFEYKAKLSGDTDEDGTNELFRKTRITVPFKFLGNFWRSIEIPLISCKVELKLK